MVHGIPAQIKGHAMPSIDAQRDKPKIVQKQPVSEPDQLQNTPNQKVNNFIHNMYHSPMIPFTHVKLWSGPDWDYNLQALVRAYEDYRRSFNDLLQNPPSMLRSAEGLYPDYGQYENVPNSGWSYYAPKSLNQQGALSVTDKIAYGTPIGHIHPSLAMSSEEKSNELVKEFKKEGGLSSDASQKYSNQFNKAMLSQLENYVDFDNLATKSDDVSRLTYTQLRSWFDNLKIILDEKKLTDFTGIPSDIDKELDIYINKRLLPDPMDPKNDKNTSASLWSEDENAIAQDLTTAKRFDYIKKYLLDTPTSVVSDENSLFNSSPKTIMNPYEGLSDTAKGMLNVRRNHLDKYLATLPHDQAKKIREEFYTPEFLGHYEGNKSIYNDTSSMQGVLPETYQKPETNFFTQQQKDLELPRNEFQEKASRMLDNMNISNEFYMRKNIGVF